LAFPGSNPGPRTINSYYLVRHKTALMSGMVGPPGFEPGKANASGS